MLQRSSTQWPVLHAPCVLCIPLYVVNLGLLALGPQLRSLETVRSGLILSSSVGRPVLIGAVLFMRSRPVGKGARAAFRVRFEVEATPVSKRYRDKLALIFQRCSELAVRYDLEPVCTESRHRIALATVLSVTPSERAIELSDSPSRRRASARSAISW